MEYRLYGLEKRGYLWNQRLTQCERIWAQHELHEVPAPSEEIVLQCKAAESPALGEKSLAKPTVRDLWGI